MGAMTTKRAFDIGYRNGVAQPHDLTMGMTWPNPRLNEAYDRGVNAGQTATMKP